LASNSKSFLLLFFKKEDLLCLPGGAAFLRSHETGRPAIRLHQCTSVSEGQMNKAGSATLAGAAVLGAGAVGARNGPQNPATALWYGRLHKPRYTPPGPLIGVAWTVLEGLLVVTGYRLLRAPKTTSRGVALAAWSATLLGLGGYPWLFFGKRRLASSTAASGAMLLSAAALAAAAEKVDRPAAAMTVPLLLWLTFATVLSEELWRKNPRLSRG